MAYRIEFMGGKSVHHEGTNFKGLDDDYRLGKLACPHVNDDQKIDVDDQKSGRPHDYWSLGSLFYKILFICSIFLLSSK